MGVSGKSQLAAQFVHEHVEEYEIVAWIAAQDGGVRDLARLAVALGLDVDGLTPLERAQRALSWLESCPGRWLLVLDNVLAPEQLATCAPAAGNGNVLVTSRNRELGDFGKVVAVDVFDEETAVGYLVDRAGRPAERDAASRLAQALGGLPLALAHAGAYCATSAGFDEYLTLLRALRPRISSTAPGSVLRSDGCVHLACIDRRGAGASAARPGRARGISIIHLAADRIPNQSLRRPRRGPRPTRSLENRSMMPWTP